MNSHNAKNKTSHFPQSKKLKIPTIIQYFYSNKRTEKFTTGTVHAQNTKRKSIFPITQRNHWTISSQIRIHIDFQKSYNKFPQLAHTLFVRFSRRFALVAQSSITKRNGPIWRGNNVGTERWINGERYPFWFGIKCARAPETASFQRRQFNCQLPSVFVNSKSFPSLPLIRDGFEKGCTCSFLVLYCVC